MVQCSLLLKTAEVSNFWCHVAMSFQFQLPMGKLAWMGENVSVQDNMCEEGSYVRKQAASLTKEHLENSSIQIFQAFLEND